MGPDPGPRRHPDQLAFLAHRGPSRADEALAHGECTAPEAEVPWPTQPIPPGRSSTSCRPRPVRRPPLGHGPEALRRRRRERRDRSRAPTGRRRPSRGTDASWAARSARPTPGREEPRTKTGDEHGNIPLRAPRGALPRATDGTPGARLGRSGRDTRPVCGLQKRKEPMKEALRSTSSSSEVRAVDCRRADETRVLLRPAPGPIRIGRPCVDLRWSHNT
jgi:hypothetical protein